MPTSAKIFKTPVLTHQQKSFIRHFVQCRRVGEAALRAGYADKQYGTALLRMPQIKQAILDAMDKSGVTDELLATKLREGLDATYPAQFYKGAGGVKQQEAPDFHTRREYLSEALKIRGDYAPEKIEQTRKTINISLTIDSGAAQGLLDSGAITELEYNHLENLWSGRDTKSLEPENVRPASEEPGIRLHGDEGGGRTTEAAEGTAGSNDADQRGGVSQGGGDRHCEEIRDSDLP